MRARARHRFVALSVAVLGVGCAFVTDLDVLTNGRDPGPSATSDSGGLDGGPGYREEVLADEPVAYWRLGEPSGEIRARDETGNGNDGTYKGGVFPGDPGAIAGDPNSAVRFKDGEVVIEDKLAFTGNLPMSIEVWASLRGDSPNFVTRQDAYDGGFHPGYSLIFWNHGVRFDRSGGPGPGTGNGYCALIAFEGKGDFLADGAYHHFVATYDTVTMKIYVDGAFADGAQRACAAEILPSSAPLLLGTNLDGRLDEVAIYDRALPDTRIRAHFEAAAKR